jgi:hypothetical protein
MQRRVQASADDARIETDILLKRDSSIFRASIATGLIGTGLVVVGVILLALHRVEFAAISECVALLSSGGTLGFRRAAKQATKRREAVTVAVLLEERALCAVGIALMISDDELRNAAMRDLAAAIYSNTDGNSTRT